MEDSQNNIANMASNYQIDFDFIDGRTNFINNSVGNNVQPANNNVVSRNNNIGPKNYVEVKPVESVQYQFEERPPKPTKQVVVNKSQVKNTKKKQSCNTGTVIRIVALILVFGWLAFLFFDLLSTWY